MPASEERNWVGLIQTHVTKRNGADPTEAEKALAELLADVYREGVAEGQMMARNPEVFAPPSVQ